MPPPKPRPAPKQPKFKEADRMEFLIASAIGSLTAAGVYLA